MNSLELGRRKYQEKKYDDALKAFNEAIKNRSSHMLLPALEGRAKVHVKLGRVDAALKDARRMIQTAPGRAQGYLVIGSILKLKNTEDGDKVAMALYERGLKKVQVGTDEGRLVLQTEFTKLQIKSFLPFRTDPVNKFPDEISLMVFALVEMPDLTRCLRVSKKWRAFLVGTKSLWKKLDLGQAKKLIAPPGLQAYMRRSQYSIDTAVIKMVPLGVEWIIATLIKYCPDFKYLAIKASYAGAWIGDSLIYYLPMAEKLETVIVMTTCSISLHSINNIIVSCKSLKVAEFRNTRPSEGLTAYAWPQLKLEQLIISVTQKYPSNISGWDVLQIADIIRTTPNLKVAKFQGWSASGHGLLDMPNFSLWTQLEELSFRNTPIERLAPLPQSLKCLDLTIENYRKNVDPFLFRDLENVEYADRVLDAEDVLKAPHLCELPNLEELYLHGVTSVHPELLEFMTRASIANKKLQVLEIPFHSCLLPKSYPRCNSLVSLSLEGFDEWDDNQIIEMVKKYIAIKKLNVAKTNVTGYGVKMITEKLAVLDEISLKDCQQVSPDTYDYLKGKGTLVIR